MSRSPRSRLSSDGLGDLPSDLELRDGLPQLARVVSKLEVLQQGGESGRLHHRDRSGVSVSFEGMVDL